MSDQIGYSDLCQMLRAAVEQIRQNHEVLSRLDSAVGDGDHGTTILRTMEAVEKAVAANTGTDLKELLAKIGWDVMGCDGGSTGPLLGTFFTGMGDGAAGKTELDRAGVVAMFEAGVAKLKTQSRAKVGDKTMMDAFLPALDALKSARPEDGIPGALRAAADAARRGSEETRNYRAKFGRARNLGDRVIGHLDPGSVSIALIFQGFSEGAHARG
jgi:dihydroxyacetone kinase-like protein